MGTFADRFRPKSFAPRYPRWMVGRPLLIGSSALASLGDALFGYSQGVIAALQVQPPFIRRFFGRDVTMEQITSGDTGVDPYVQGKRSSYTLSHHWRNCQRLTSLYRISYHCGMSQHHCISCRFGCSLYLRHSWPADVRPDRRASLPCRCHHSNLVA